MQKNTDFDFRIVLSHIKFQFSIGDASILARAQEALAASQFQFSIGDASHCCLAGSAIMSASGFQFSIGDAGFLGP